MKSFVVALLSILLIPVFSNSQTTKPQASFVCQPCGNDCDQKVYTQQGTCRHCQMPLVPTSSVRHSSIKPQDICMFISNNPDVVLLDVRTKDEFDGKGKPHFPSLKNAINIPVQELETRIEELAQYKNKTVLVYCSHSHRSPRASHMLTQSGFTKVFNMEGGMSVVTDRSCTN